MWNKFSEEQFWLKFYYKNLAKFPLETSNLANIFGCRRRAIQALFVILWIDEWKCMCLYTVEVCRKSNSLHWLKRAQIKQTVWSRTKFAWKNCIKKKLTIKVRVTRYDTTFLATLCKQNLIQCVHESWYLCYYESSIDNIWSRAAFSLCSACTLPRWIYWKGKWVISWPAHR